MWSAYSLKGIFICEVMAVSLGLIAIPLWNLRLSLGIDGCHREPLPTLPPPPPTPPTPAQNPGERVLPLWSSRSLHSSSCHPGTGCPRGLWPYPRAGIYSRLGQFSSPHRRPGDPWEPAWWQQVCSKPNLRRDLFFSSPHGLRKRSR